MVQIPSQSKSFQNRHQDLQLKRAATSSNNDNSELKQRAKSEENVELKVVEVEVEVERLENEASNVNSPKQIKSLNHSGEDKLECEMSMSEDVEVKPSKPTTSQSESSTKETNQPTVKMEVVE
jgi:hypothetical protein